MRKTKCTWHGKHRKSNKVPQVNEPGSYGLYTKNHCTCKCVVLEFLSNPATSVQPENDVSRAYRLHSAQDKLRQAGNACECHMQEFQISIWAGCAASGYHLCLP